jgi:acetyltransferase
VLRPIRPEDEPLMVQFHGSLSERTVAPCYFQALKLSTRVEYERLTRTCFIDYDREMVLVADREDPESGRREILGVGRLSMARRTDEAEFALSISDRFQNQGLGTALLAQLLHIGRQEPIIRIFGLILPENHALRRVCAKLDLDLEDLVVQAVIDLVP